MQTARGDQSAFSQRRIRHVTAISVRNLTPYPARDEFASALNKPSEQSQFTSHGHLVDDLDVNFSRDTASNLTRKRSRRVSTASNKTLRSMRSDEGTGELEDIGEQPRAGRAKVAFPETLGGTGSTSGKSPASISRAPTIRPANRKRTSSMNSAFFLPPSAEEEPLAGPSVPPISWSSMLPDNSQASLERVINSRLVETFVAISVPTPPAAQTSAPGTPTSEQSPRTRPSTPPHSAPTTKEKFTPSTRRGVSTKVMPTSPSAKSPPPSPASTKSAFITRKEIATSPRVAATKASAAHSRSSSLSSLRANGRPTPTRLSSKPATPTLPASPPPSSSPSPTPPKSTGPESIIPNYLSAIHRPSTNPTFAIDARAGAEFAEWTDLSGEKMKIEVWGKVGHAWHGSSSAKGKERAEGGDAEWNVLESWEIDLAELVPLPDEMVASSKVPPNTLLITLSPPGQTYYIPAPVAPNRPSLEAMGGYNSDPELDSRKDRQVGDLVLSAASPPIFLQNGLPDAEKSVSALVKSRVRSHRDGAAKTSSWQDLLKLVTLQACVVDTEGSLSEVMGEIDKILAADVTSSLKREVSERESRLLSLGDDLESVEDRSRELRQRIETRREDIRERREMFSVANHQYTQEVELEVSRERELISERDTLTSLRADFTPIRTSLMTTLSTIYPIDLVSPPDLLFTILDVPLPIPLTAADPGPPLSLPAHKEVTEDAVATALGYAAQVVQLMAAYLGKGLVYPVTCVGSRSLIRDGISAMVGPRMFPLFSKGVDTYRFEYGVFLLNKDIELLMADRDLRALDMRHTLPNLKNLLLTLADGDGATTIQRPPRVVLNSPSLSEVGLGSPPSTLEVTPSTSTVSFSAAERLHEDEGEGGNASGSSTPTAATPVDTSRRSFLGLSPLAGFLRARYPSVIVPPKPEHVEESSTAIPEEDEEEDRRTIRGVALDGEPEEGIPTMDLEKGGNTNTSTTTPLIQHVG